MAIGTIIPSTLVSAAVYWEVLAIVVKCRWSPPIFVVTSGTISRKLGSCVVGFGCIIVVRLMTTHTGIRRIAKITVMATGAIIGYQCVCAIEGVERVVVKRRWRPAILRMAGHTIRGKIAGGMVRIGRCIVIIQVAAGTGIRRIVVIAIVAGRTVVGDGSVSAIQLIIIIVNLESCGLPSGLSGVATCTVRR